MPSARFSVELAVEFAAMTLGNVVREYPHKLDHVMSGPADVRGPRELHPIFFGCFDWHSAVHGYWQLARIRRLFPDLPVNTAIDARFDDALAPANVQAELDYAKRPHSRGFERPYGWAWLLKLCDELARFDDEPGKCWHRTLLPLAQWFAARFVEFLPNAVYPVRVGAHPNTAFALSLAHDYAVSHQDHALLDIIQNRARAWYGGDQNCQAWEPSLDEFLSPALVEALCMMKVLPTDEFRAWFDRFLPRLRDGEPATLFRPATVTDRTDGKIAHLDGLNLSRAWCMRALAGAFVPDAPLAQVLRNAAAEHLHASLPHIADDYAGEHWLASFALLAMTQSQP